MNVVNPNNENHTLKIIPRIYEGGGIVFELYNEQTNTTDEPEFTSELINGYLFIYFDFTFIDKQKFQIKITQNNEVIYRGKLIATTQNTQTYKADKDLYYYE